MMATSGFGGVTRGAYENYKNNQGKGLKNGFNVFNGHLTKDIDYGACSS